MRVSVFFEAQIHWTLTISGEVHVFKEVVGVRLAEVVSVQVESGKADRRPSHDLPVDLAYKSLEIKLVIELLPKPPGLPLPPCRSNELQGQSGEGSHIGVWADSVWRGPGCRRQTCA
jgi:hypothetical protein